MVFVECNISLRRTKRQSGTVYKYNKANWTDIKVDIKNTTECLSNNYSTSNIDELWKLFKEGLLTSVDKNIPQKKITNSMKLPWITNKLRLQINRNKRLHRKCKTNSNLKDKYKNNKRQLQSDIRKAYWHCIENMIFDLPVNEPDNPCIKRIPKKLFSYIKGMKTDNSGILALCKDGILTNDTTYKANILNNQFEKAFTTESPDIPIPDKGPSPYSTMHDIHITKNGITKLLHNINPHKATGPDQVSEKILKELSSDITPAIQLIFQKSLSTGTIPTDWKHANVCPVFKKGDKHNAINYRPVSLTCILYKLCEHIISSNIMQHLEKHSILYDLQHGFRSARSCETQLVSFIQELASSTDKNIQTDVIVMDFAKAFDKVPHKRLLYKLKYYGISNNTLNWIQDFLSLRTQTVILEGTHSDKIQLTSGVPQGTVLGPILFFIYINDFNEYLTHSTLRLFADDSIIYREIRSPSDTHKLQHDLDAAAKWEQDWLMSFHPDKCSILRITTKKRPILHNYILHGPTLATETSTKYLGVTIQNNLKWNEHIDNITASATKQLNFLKRNLKVTSPKIKERAYQSIVRPGLEYNSCTWDPHHQYQIHQLEMVQRRAARYVTNRFHNTSSVNSMLTDLNWPTLQQRRLRT